MEHVVNVLNNLISRLLSSDVVVPAFFLFVALIFIPLIQDCSEDHAADMAARRQIQTICTQQRGHWDGFSCIWTPPHP